MLYTFLTHNSVSVPLLRAAVRETGDFLNLLIISWYLIAEEYEVKLCPPDFFCVLTLILSFPLCHPAGFV